MTQFSVSQETSTKLELVWGQRVWGAGGRDIKHGQGVISPGEIQTFQKDEGVCVCSDGILPSLPFFLLLLHLFLLLHLYCSYCQMSDLSDYFNTNWCVDIYSNAILHLQFKCSLPKGVWAIFICIQNVNQNRNWNCLFTRFKLWMRETDCE